MVPHGTNSAPILPIVSMTDVAGASSGSGSRSPPAYRATRSSSSLRAPHDGVMDATPGARAARYSPQLLFEQQQQHQHQHQQQQQQQPMPMSRAHASRSTPSLMRITVTPPGAPPYARHGPRHKGGGRGGHGGTGSPRRGGGGGSEAARQDCTITVVGGRVYDPRTTLMIRNIPNKYTQCMLIEQIERESPGCFDFLYLPIDFQNNCNMGYAFANVVSTDYVPVLMASMHSRRWERFNSDKVCEIAYARIQGLDQLLSHFKNSSLLAEDKKVRPVILLNGRYVPYPDQGVAIRVHTVGTRKYLVTFVVSSNTSALFYEQNKDANSDDPEYCV